MIDSNCKNMEIEIHGLIIERALNIQVVPNAILQPIFTRQLLPTTLLW